MNKFGLGANFTSQQKESLVHRCIKTFLLTAANEKISVLILTAEVNVSVSSLD